jgi:tape measure domain-containing protein
VQIGLFFKLKNMAADINIKIGAQITDLQKKLKQAERSLKRSGSKMQSIGMGLMASLTAPLAALGGSAIKAAGDFESMSNGLTAIMGDADLAAAELEKLKEAAKNPGLGFAQAVKGSVRLQSIGLDANLARENMLAMGNAIALVGGGAEELDRATLAMQQIGAKGKVSAEEINQLNEVIPQIRAVMNDTFGTSDGQELTKMGVDANTFIEEITKGLQKLPQAQGGIKNAIENTGIAMQSFLSSLGMELNEAFNIQGNVESFANRLTEISERFSSLDERTQKIIFTLGGLVIAIGPALFAFGKMQTLAATLTGNYRSLVTFVSKMSTVVKSATVSQAGFNAVMAANPVGVVVVAIAALVAAFVLAYKNIDSFRNLVDTTYQKVLKPLGEFLYQLGVIAFETFKGIASAIWDMYKTAWDVFMNLTKVVLDFFNKIPFVGKIIDWLKKTFASAINFISKAFNNLPALFAGLVAEARNTSDKVISFFKRLALSAEITAKKVQRALTVGADARALIDKQIKALSKQRKELENQGEEFGVAFREAFDAEMDKVKTPKVILTKTDAEPKATEDTGTGTGTAPSSIGTIKKTTAATEEQTQAVKNQAVALQTLDTKQLQVSSSSKLVLQNVEQTGAAMNQMSGETEDFAATIAELETQLHSIAQTGLQDLAVGFGEGIGAMASGAGNLQTIAGSMLSTIGGVLMQLGKLAIQTGIAIEGIKLALKSLNPAVAVAGGIALVALAKFVQNKAANLSESGSAKLPAFANGGLVTAPTLGMFGEAGPEALIPKKRLDSLLASAENGGNGGVGMLTTRISGNDLEIVLDKTRRRNNRVR